MYFATVSCHSLRFNKENKETINPYSYMPFGMGPRNCIGMRFALISIKLAIVELLQRFTITTCAETEVRGTPTFDIIHWFVYLFERIRFKRPHWWSFWLLTLIWMVMCKRYPPVIPTSCHAIIYVGVANRTEIYPHKYTHINVPFCLLTSFYQGQLCCCWCLQSKSSGCESL